METRLKDLKKELENGQTELLKLTRRQTEMHETLLRISGAIQVLEELLAERHSLSKLHEAAAEQ